MINLTNEHNMIGGGCMKVTASVLHRCLFIIGVFLLFFTKIFFHAVVNIQSVQVDELPAPPITSTLLGRFTSS